MDPAFIRELYSLDASKIIAGLMVLFWTIGEVAFRCGRRHSLRRLPGENPQSQAIEAAVLTLFGLLLGFTFSMSAQRFEARKQGLLEEANAIGTAYLRAALVEPPATAAIRDSLRGYLDARLEHYQAPLNEPQLQAANVKADGFQRQAWELAVAAGQKKPTPLSALLISALNEMIDLREKQTVAFENIVPQTVLAFLLFLALIAVSVVGYLNGIGKARQSLLCLVFGGVVASTLFLVIDLDRPRRGPIRLSHTSLLRLRAQFVQDVAPDNHPRNSDVGKSPIP